VPGSKGLLMAKIMYIGMAVRPMAYKERTPRSLP